LITKPFVNEQFGRLRRDPAHPYIRGLQSLGVAELLRRNRCLRKIFESSGRISITQMLTCFLHKQVSEDPEQADKEKTTFEYFVTFLQQVSRKFFVYFFFIVFY
jgi:hypothetical protein